MRKHSDIFAKVKQENAVLHSAEVPPQFANAIFEGVEERPAKVVPPSAQFQNGGKTLRV